MKISDSAISSALRLLTATSVALAAAGCGGGASDDDDANAGKRYAQRCGLPEATREPSRLPAPSGDHCIGKAGFLALDTRRAETFSGGGERRELNLKIWYPITPAPAAARADYLEAGPWQLLLAELPEALATLVVPTHARRNVPMAMGQSYPVVLFSPGWGLSVEQYSVLLEDLASHGHVVVAINHAYVTGPTELSGGRLAVQELAEPSDATMQIMVEDQRFVLDWLQARAAESGSHLLGGHLDLGRIGSYGHSFGGSAALQTARQDERVRVAIDMDGSVFGDLGQPWHKPLMFLLSEESPGHSDPSIETVWRQRQGPGLSQVLKGAGHNDFSDLKILLAPYRQLLPVDLFESLSLGPIEAGAALRATREQTRQFLQTHLQR